MSEPNLSDEVGRMLLPFLSDEMSFAQARELADELIGMTKRSLATAQVTHVEEIRGMIEKLREQAETHQRFSSAIVDGRAHVCWQAADLLQRILDQLGSLEPAGRASHGATSVSPPFGDHQG